MVMDVVHERAEAPRIHRDSYRRMKIVKRTHSFIGIFRGQVIYYTHCESWTKLNTKITLPAEEIPN